MVLHGSLVFGDYAAGHSDVDLLAIVERPLLEREMEALTSAVAAEHSAVPLDLRVVTRRTAAAPPEAPPMELYVRLGRPGQVEIERRRAEPDLVVELSVARSHGRALVGANPPTLIGAVPDEWVLAVGDAQLARWESLTDDARAADLMVLTACRIWRFAEERSHCAKSAAGSWVLARDPSLEAVRGALRRRAGEPVQIDPAEIGRLLKTVRRRLRLEETGHGEAPPRPAPGRPPQATAPDGLEARGHGADSP